MSLPVSLTRLPRDRVEEVLHLALAPGQEAFVAAVPAMVLESRAEVDFHVIRAGGRVAGFFKIDRAFEARDPRLGEGAHGLRGLVVDAGLQGRGIGRAAMAALPDHVRAHYPGLARLHLTVDAANAPAIGLYEGTGWRRLPVTPFPGRSGPEPVYALDLAPGAATALTLAPLPRWAVGDALGLRLPPAQEVLAGSVATLAGDDDPDTDFHTLREGGIVRGVFKIERHFGARMPFGPDDAHGLRMLLIDHAEQGRGLGGALLAALPAYLRRHYPGMRWLYLTVNSRNPRARHVYLRGGWEETGELYHGGAAGPQHVMRLAL